MPKAHSHQSAKNSAIVSTILQFTSLNILLGRGINRRHWFNNEKGEEIVKHVQYYQIFPYNSSTKFPTLFETNPCKAPWIQTQHDFAHIISLIEPPSMPDGLAQTWVQKRKGHVRTETLSTCTSSAGDDDLEYQQLLERAFKTLPWPTLYNYNGLRGIPLFYGMIPSSNFQYIWSLWGNLPIKKDTKKVTQSLW